MNQTIDRNQDATVYVGNLDERCTEALIWELMLQAGPVVNVHLPKDRVSQSHQGYGFCEFLTEEDADYCIKILNMVKLFGKPIRVNKATSDTKKSLDVGANLFVGNLSLEVDEKMLYETFVQFGSITQTPTIARDPANGTPKGYGFVSYDSFEAADAAVDAMNGQFLANKALIVSFAFKKDGKGERHGSAAERLLAAQAKVNNPDSGRTIHDLRPNDSSSLPMVPPPPPQLNQQYGVPPPGIVPMQPNMQGMPFQPPPPGFMPPPGYAPPPPGPYYPQYPPSNFY